MIKILSADETRKLRERWFAGEMTQEELKEKLISETSVRYAGEPETNLEKRIRQEWLEGVLANWSRLYVTFFFYPVLGVKYTNQEFWKAKEDLETLGYKVLSGGSSTGNAVLQPDSNK